jgi:hypothetical protein
MPQEELMSTLFNIAAPDVVRLPRTAADVVVREGQARGLEKLVAGEMISEPEP